MLFLLISCLGGGAVEWVAPPKLAMIGMLGMSGEQIAWGQLEVNAGRNQGKDCVALLSLKTVKMRADCASCVSASEMLFTDDINNTIPAECSAILSGVTQAVGKHWSLGYDETGAVFAFKNGQWSMISSNVEKQAGMMIFQVQ